MNRKKFIASITALACCAGMMSIMPELGENTYASELVNNDFEVNYDGWYGNADSVNLIADSSYGYENTRGMLVSGRISPTDGASSSKGFYLSGGVNYDYSIQVYSENTEKFHLSLLYIDEDTGEETTVELTSKDVEGGKWTKLSAEYKAPENSYEFRLTITTDSTNDFCFDNVLITTKQKKGVVYAESTEKGLKDEFANYFRVGNILNGGTVQNSTITATILKDFNSIECENETKPDATLVQSQCSGTNIGVSLNSCASIMDFCVQNNIAMRGHTLVWHSQTPEWFFKTNFDANGSWVDTATMDARMESYIKNMFETIATQYPSLNLYAYDVANECISDDSNRTANYGGAREGGYGDGKSPWVQVYGDNSFVEKAFTYARKYAPSTCALYYNDYNEYWDHKRDAIYNMCKSLYEKGLLDGVGMQSHVPANATGFAGTDSYIEAMKKYLSIGCDVQITELDISIENGNYTYDEQAEKYKAIFQAAIDWNKNPTSSGRVTAVCIWGPNDANSWLSSGSNALLYDSNNQPKTAYYTLSSMLPESEWGDGSNPNTDTGTNSGAEPNDYGWYFYDSFEESESDWKSRGSNTIGLSGRTSYVGTNSLLVSDRTAVWNGAEKSLDTSVFKAGEEYSFSVCVSYLDGADSEKFSLTLQYTGTDGETHYANIDSKEVVKGNFVQLYNKNYKIPDDVASDLKLVVETTGETMNFYMDEAIGAVAGTTILGPEPVETTTVSTTTTTTTTTTATSTSTKYLAGDANCDGIVDIADAVAVAGYVGDAIENSLSDEGKINADVQGNGNGINAGDALMIQQYLAKIVDELTLPSTVVTPVTVTVDTVAMEQLFSSVTPNTSYKKDGENNPLFTQRFGADPGVMEYNGRIYVYTTNDVIEYDSNGNVTENTYGQINKINCISSDDMVNWTDHGSIEVAGENGVATWASLSWAPCATHKTINGKEKFFLYFCNGANGVSVLTADSPTGPWSDPLGHALVTRSTTNCSDVNWLFDPAVFVDDDGTGYLCFGGGYDDGQQAHPKTARVVKLGDDMISLANDPQEIDAPYLFEDSGINKIGDKYYYTYCSNFSTSGNEYGLNGGSIQYMVADDPMGPYTYVGELFPNQGNFFGLYGNNHHSITSLNGQLYLFYHNRSVEQAMGIEGNYRSPQVDKITVNGTNISAVGTMAGISQLKTLNPYDKVQAETISRQAGINVSGLGDTVVNDVQKGDWISVSGADFSNGATALTVRVASNNGASIKVCTGSENGTAIGYVEIPATGGEFKEITVPVNSISGTNDIYFIFSDELEFDWWSFS